MNMFLSAIAIVSVNAQAARALVEYFASPAR